MSDNNLKKMIVFSDLEIKEQVTSFIKKQSKIENCVESKFVEECLLKIMVFYGDDFARKTLSTRYRNQAQFYEIINNADFFRQTTLDEFFDKEYIGGCDEK